MKTTLSLGLALLGCGMASHTLAAANQYQIEVSVGYAYIKDDQTEFSASAQMYFAPVDISKHVLSEAAFLGRVSNLKVGYGKPTFFYDGQSIHEGDDLVDFVFTELSAEWFSDVTGMYMSFYQQTYAVEGEQFDFPDYDDWGARIGFLPMEGILVYTAYEDEEGYNPNFTVKYVSTVTNGKAVNLEAHYIDLGDDDRRNYLKVGADVYLSRYFSFGGTIAQQDDTVFSIRTRYFFNPAYSIGAFARTGDDVSDIGVSASIRF